MAFKSLTKTPIGQSHLVKLNCTQTKPKAALWRIKTIFRILDKNTKIDKNSYYGKTKNYRRPQGTDRSGG